MTLARMRTLGRSIYLQPTLAQACKDISMCVFSSYKASHHNITSTFVLTALILKFSIAR